MMKKIILVAVFFAGTVAVNAQVDLIKQAGKISSTATAVSKFAGAGNLLSQIAGGIVPTAFKSNMGAQKTSLLGKLGKVSSLSQTGQSLGQLIGLIKPTAFKSGFAAKIPSLISTANKAASLASIGKTASSLLGGLKNESMTSGLLGQKATLLTTLAGLK
jgi:hypothetical protein